MEYSMLKEGGVIKTFVDWKKGIEFDSWVELIEHNPKDEYTLPLTRGSYKVGVLPFVKRDVVSERLEMPEIGDMFWVEDVVGVVIIRDWRSDEIVMQVGHELITASFPFSFKPYYHTGRYHVYNSSYMGIYDISNDDGCRFSARREGEDTRRLKRKTHRAEPVERETRSVLFSGQRWKVAKLRPCFMSEISGTLHHKDVGMVEIEEVTKDSITYSRGKTVKTVKKDPSAFLTKGNHFSHKIIPFYLTTAAQYSCITKGWFDEADDDYDD